MNHFNPMLSASLGVLILAPFVRGETPSDYPISPVPLTSKQIQDSFWKPRLDINRTISISHNFHQCELTGRIDSFTWAAQKMENQQGGVYFDSDVYKVIEGASYYLADYPDPELTNYLDNLIKVIASAQEDDGYLHTFRIINPKHKFNGDSRFSHPISHELFNAGHLYEAAVAHYQATRRRGLLDIALKNADLVCHVFGDGKKNKKDHAEIELALVKLYKITGREKYLNLAKRFCDFNLVGVGLTRRKYAKDAQEYEAAGHAVASTYAYCGMTDLIALQRAPEYRRLINSLWEGVVSKKLYLNGGIGNFGEYFGAPYVLSNSALDHKTVDEDPTDSWGAGQPPEIETCAAIAFSLWNHRLFQLYGDAKYIDVLERTLYNVFSSSVSLAGDTFFYANAQLHDGKRFCNAVYKERVPFFQRGGNCCPTNIVRLFPQIPSMIYAQKEDNFYVNLFIDSDVTLNVKGAKVGLHQKTNYPWDGHIEIHLEPEKPVEFALNIRVPGWTRNQPLPSDLYRYMNNREENVTLDLNAEEIPLQVDKGFAVIQRQWKKGDIIQIDLPMPVRRVLCHDAVTANTGKVALERGPIVYCAEGVDNNNKVLDLVLSDNAKLQSEYHSDLLNGVVIIKAQSKQHDIVAIPYNCWLNRGQNEMTVWFHREAIPGKP